MVRRRRNEGPAAMFFNQVFLSGELFRNRRPARRRNVPRPERVRGAEVLEVRLLLSGTDVVLDPVVESESLGGASNDSQQTAQSLESSFVLLDDGGRAAYVAVLGTAEGAPALPPVLEAESNDTPATAQDLDGESFTLAFDPDVADSTVIPHITILGTGDGTFDYYSFTVNAGDVGIFDIDDGAGGTGGFDSYMFLYDSNGTLLALSDDSSTDAGGGGSISNLDSFLRYTFTTGGTYIIGIAEYFSFDGGGQIAGNPPDAGDTYTLQVSLQGKPVVPPPGDFYSFELQAGENATVLATAVSAGNLAVELQDASGSTVAGGDALHNFFAPTAGTYYVVVSGSGVDYRLVVARNADLDTESNNDLGSAQAVLSGWVVGDLDSGELSGVIAEVESNDSLVGAQDLDDAGWTLAENPEIAQSTSNSHVTIHGTGDGTFDYYSFTVTNAGDVGLFDIDDGGNGTGPMDTVIFLYDASGNLLAVNDDGSGGLDAGSSSGLDSFLQYTFAAPGTYVIAVAEYHSLDSGGELSGNPPDAGDTYTLHVSVQNHAVAAPADWYQVQLGENQRLLVETSSVSGSGLDPMVRVYDSAGNLVAVDDNSGPDGRGAVLSYDIPQGAAGTYYIEIVPSTATAETTEGDYILSIHSEDVGGSTGSNPGNSGEHSQADSSAQFTQRSSTAAEHSNRRLGGVHSSSPSPAALRGRAIDRLFANDLDFLLTS
jgi:hypothetical protein